MVLHPSLRLAQPWCLNSLQQQQSDAVQNTARRNLNMVLYVGCAVLCWCLADSPAPAEPPGRRLNSVGQQLGLAPIRVPRGSHVLGNRPGSPMDSFSFGPRQEEEVRTLPAHLLPAWCAGHTSRVHCAVRLKAAHLLDHSSSNAHAGPIRMHCQAQT